MTRSEFERTLSEQNILTLRIIYAALSSGITIFAIVATVLSGSSTGQKPDGIEILTLLSGVHALMMLTIYSAVPMIFRNMVTAADASRPPSGEVQYPEIIQKITKAHIVRLALFEGTAMFGLVVCLLAGLWGAYDSFPEFILNGLSAVIFLGVASATFPTRDRLSGVFSKYFG